MPYSRKLKSEPIDGGEKEDLKLELTRVEQEVKILNQKLIQLREHQKQFQKVRQMASILSWEVNILTGRLTVSEEGIDLFGGKLFHATSLDDLVEWIHPEDREQFQAAYDSSLKKGGSFELTHRLLFPTGDRWTVTHHCMTFLATNGMPLRSSGLMQDITQHKQTRDELEIRVRNRTEELNKAKKTAEKASRAKSEFLSRMSHELRTPMNAILGFTQLLEMDQKNPLADYQKKHLSKVSSAGNHLLELINEVLDLSRIESEHFKLSIKTVDIIQIVEDVVSSSKPLADKNNISMEHLKPSGEICFVDLDPLRFKQVIWNLVSNSIKYNKPGGMVTLSYAFLKDGKVRVEVKDTGYGISPDRKSKVFKPFERFDLFSEQIEGTGIGLSISQKLVELMNGTIDFESIPEVGSCFYIDLFISDKVSIRNHLIGEDGSTRKKVQDLKTKKILYIEDIPANVELVEHILSLREDLELLSAPTGTEGIKLAQSQFPDLIILDIQLPDMDGLAVFSEINAIKETRNIPVIALTADAMDVDINRALKMGFRDYITKPIEIKKFMEAVEKILLP